MRIGKREAKYWAPVYEAWFLSAEEADLADTNFAEAGIELKHLWRICTVVENHRWCEYPNPIRKSGEGLARKGRVVAHGITTLTSSCDEGQPGKVMIEDFPVQVEPKVKLELSLCEDCCGPRGLYSFAIVCQPCALSLFCSRRAMSSRISE